MERSIPLRLRILDLAVVLVVLPAVLLVGVLLAIVIKLESPGPVFYRARRVGRGGVPFEMLKFRKMLEDARGMGLTRENDPRLTRMGRFLMVTRLDELPQLWNVLKGQMRVVGPRPEAPEFVEAHRDSYDEVLAVAPGVTGVAQLAFSDERNLLDDTDVERLYVDEIMPHKISLDLDYVRNHGLRRDLAILWRTFWLPVVAIVGGARQRGADGTEKVRTARREQAQGDAFRRRCEPDSARYSLAAQPDPER
jgi:lipopolysaccharide/colanic/teichoic acid biosynthesis glycosyltransferase